eukprot:scaffold31330_cov18-Tisochrysis_lutea.AAC.2
MTTEPQTLSCKQRNSDAQNAVPSCPPPKPSASEFWTLQSSPLLSLAQALPSHCPPPPSAHCPVVASLPLLLVLGLLLRLLPILLT